MRVRDRAPRIFFPDAQDRALRHHFPRTRQRALRAGFTLVEAALVLSLTGVLLAAFVPTFLKHVRTSKLAEAAELLESLHRHAASYYEAGHTVGMQLGRHCLPESAGPFPLEPSRDPISVDFSADESGRATWTALGEHEARELRYSYEVIVPEPGCRERANGTAITFRAIGDLDGDGNHSLLERSAAPTSDRRTLAPRGPLRVVSRSE